MIWIVSQRLLFVHNPKCVGTSIHKALLTQFPDATVGWGRHYDAERDEIKDMAHLSVREARVHLGLTGSFRSFGFVRDPYARFISSYLHFKHWNPDHASLTPEELAFDLLDEARIRTDWRFVHFAPQYRFFYEGKRRVVAHIWKVEDLPQAWREVQKEFAIDSDLTQENRLGYESFEPMSTALTGRINTLYARDFALFGYTAKPGQLPARRTRDYYARFARLLPERRGLDISDAAEL
jgi:hypothetical protein